MSNSTYCFNFTAVDLNNSRAISITLQLLAILACFLVIFFIFYTKQHLQFVNRLILYLILVSLVWSVAIILQTVPVYHNNEEMDVAVREGWEGMCAAIGFLSQVMETLKLSMVCWIVLHLFLLINFKRDLRKRNHEAAGLAIVLTVPILKDWIPFAVSRYGLSGLWCWISLTTKDCHNYKKGIIIMALVEYIPALLAISFTFVCFVCVMITLCRRARRKEIKWKWAAVYQQGLAEATSLMAYPVLFAVALVFRVTHRSWYMYDILKSHSPSAALWHTHSVALGITGILIPFLYIMRPSNLKKFYLCRRILFRKTRHPISVVYRTSSVISTEGCSDREPIIKDSSDKSRESNQFYTRSIFSALSD